MSIINYYNKVFLLNTSNTSYVICIDTPNLIRNAYWGSRIERIEDFAEFDFLKGVNHPSPNEYAIEECSSFGGMRFKETSLKVRFSDGVRDFRYKVTSCDVDDNLLTITLDDIYYHFRVKLYYKVYEEYDIIEKWRTAENLSGEAAVLERFYSGEFGLEGTGYKTINFNGQWGSEFRLFNEPVDSGKKVFESLRGLTAHTANPLFIVHKDADEDHGDVYYGALAYSGNFKVVLETTPSRHLNIQIGISDTDFEWKLVSGEIFTAPSVFFGYTPDGFGKMTNTMSNFTRAKIMPKPLANKALPVLYNSWYATLFDVKCDEQIALAERAAKMGVELFVIDDGWFEGRTSDKAGLGDWYVDRNKFPNGLTPLIKRVNELGMDFGVWIEPEMVNENSNLYRAHPDWIYRYDTREVLMGRNQYMLDMTNPEVISYLIDCFDKLLSENNIAYIKWDMNRYASEMASAYHDKSEYKSMWYQNTQGIYALISALREKHPNVEFEACASGGGRVDFGAMQYFDEYWPSDNTDPLDRLFIQESYSYLYPIKYMRAWLTDDFGMDGRAIPLKFSMHCHMCGSLGIGINLNQVPDEKLEEIKKYIDLYKFIRNTVQFGDLYRLKSINKGDLHAVEYVLDKQTAVFVFSDHERYGEKCHRLKLKGLDKNKLYAYEIDGKEYIKSGAYLLNIGLDLTLCGDYDSKLVVLTALDSNVD